MKKETPQDLQQLLMNFKAAKLVEPVEPATVKKEEPQISEGKLIDFSLAQRRLLLEQEKEKLRRLLDDDLQEM